MMPTPPISDFTRFGIDDSSSDEIILAYELPNRLENPTPLRIDDILSGTTQKERDELPTEAIMSMIHHYRDIVRYRESGEVLSPLQIHNIEKLLRYPYEKLVEHCRNHYNSIGGYGDAKEIDRIAHFSVKEYLTGLKDILLNYYTKNLEDMDNLLEAEIQLLQRRNGTEEEMKQLILSGGQRRAFWGEARDHVIHWEPGEGEFPFFEYVSLRERWMRAEREMPSQELAV